MTCSKFWRPQHCVLSIFWASHGVWICPFSFWLWWRLPHLWWHQARQRPKLYELTYLYLNSSCFTFTGSHVSPYNFGLCRAWCHHKRGSLHHNQQEKGQIHVPWLAQNFDSLRYCGSHLLCSAIFSTQLVDRLFVDYLSSYNAFFVTHHAYCSAYIRLFHHSHKVRTKIF